MNEMEIRKELFAAIHDAMYRPDAYELSAKDIYRLAQAYEILHGIEQAETLPNDTTIGFCD